MDAMEAILGRRSIRKYKPGNVSDEMVEQLLRAAMSAPSAGNEQPWHFVVIRARETLASIPKFHPHSRMLCDADVGILTCGDLKLEVYKGFWVQDCSAATQNMLIAAHALGLGAVWLGIYPLEERIAGIRKLLGLPEDVIPLSLVSIGWPAEEKVHVNRFRPDRVHYEKW